METLHKLSAAQLDQLYRLAWLVMGDERLALRRFRAAGGERRGASFRAQPRAHPLGRVVYGAASGERQGAGGGAVTQILARLAPKRTFRYPLNVPDAALARSGLTPSEHAALARMLRAATPQARLELGAPHLLDLQGQGDKGAEGVATDGGRQMPDEADADHAAVVSGRSSVVTDSVWPRRATTGTELYLLIAQAWGDLPAETPYTLALNHARALFGQASETEVQPLRAALLADGAAGERARAVRNGLRRADDRLAAALPALFAGEAPPELHALHDPTVEMPPERRAAKRAARLQFILAGAVLALVIAVIVAPGRPAEAPQSTAERTGLLAAEATLAPQEVVRAALDRFERGDVGADALHERYRMTIEGETRTLERWYDAGAPERVRVEVRDDSDQLLFAIATDGATQLQARWQINGDSPSQVFGFDYLLDAALLEQLAPIVRRQPDGLHFFASLPLVNPEHFYLAQAYAAEVQDLGTTMINERPARLIGFASRQAFPPAEDRLYDASPQEQADQVILAIDTATFALLEVRVLPQSEAAGAVATPWQVEVFTTRSDLTAADFVLAAVDAQSRRGASRFISPRVTWLPDDVLSSLDRAIATTPLPLAFPPPEGPSLGYVLQAGSESILVRESEHELFMIAVFPVESVPQLAGRQEERQAGDLRYRMIYPEAQFSPAMTSLVALPLENGAELQMYYQHAYATLPEREARIVELLTALEPLTRESADVVAADFVR